jgi:hypothetical protein
LQPLSFNGFIKFNRCEEAPIKRLLARVQPCTVNQTHLDINQTGTYDDIFMAEASPNAKEDVHAAQLIVRRIRSVDPPDCFYQSGASAIMFQAVLRIP